MCVTKSLLGKVYLTIHDFPKAESKLQEVSTLGYALLPKYTDLFDYTKDEHHSEYIFDIEYEQGMGEGNCFTTNFTPKNPPLAAFYGVTGGQNGNNNPPRSLFNIFPPGDLRKDITAADRDSLTQMECFKNSYLLQTKFRPLQKIHGSLTCKLR